VQLVSRIADRLDASNIANCLGNRKGLTACHVGSVVACRVCSYHTHNSITAHNATHRQILR